jgi:hypothetical protein
MERDLLLALYCADGSALSPQRLGALLWDRATERSPITLRRHIAGTRKAAAGEIVVTHRQGTGTTSYSLGIDREHIDAFRFERQVADGGREFRQDRYEESAWKLGQALTLWRGAPLADAASRPFARAQITRLTNMHRTAVITKLKADISLGQHREASSVRGSATGTCKNCSTTCSPARCPRTAPSWPRKAGSSGLRAEVAQSRVVHGQAASPQVSPSRRHKDVTGRMKAARSAKNADSSGAGGDRGYGRRRVGP